MMTDPDASPAPAPACRLCGRPLEHVAVDLGMSPLCESYVPPDVLDRMEPFYPLRAFVCASCFLMQLPEYVPPEQIFREYAYFSSYSDSWVAHARRYAEDMHARLPLDGTRRVVEIGSNDGYLLRHFASLGVPVLGVEPAANVAADARARGITTLVRFFDSELARELVAGGVRADLLVANNVLAQVPRLNDFIAGLAVLLAPDGLLTLEFPHVLQLLDGNQFDTIYHEHFSYFSLGTAQRAMERHGLAVVDVEELATHGGSLRLHVRHAAAGTPIAGRLDRLLAREQQAGLETVDRFVQFGAQVEATKRELLGALINLCSAGHSIVGYGAPGKANTLLNYCGIRADMLSYTVDRNPYKQGRYTPGTHIPILHPDRIRETRPDYVWILPWNLRDEIADQLRYVRDWNGRLMVAIPHFEVLP